MARGSTTSLRRWIGPSFLVVLFASPSAAQQADTSKLAGEMAAYLTNPRYVPKPATGENRRVVVVPFSRDGEVTQFGAALAVDIGRELARVSDQLDVADPKAVTTMLRASGLWPEDLATEAIACWLAEEHGSAYALTGTFSRRRNGVRVDVRGIPCARGMRGFRARADLEATPEMLDRLVGDRVFPVVVVPANVADETAIAVEVGKGGIIGPSCVSCPEPNFSPAARENRVQGGVVLRLVITAEGRARHVRLTRGLPHGLNAEAFRAVSRWQFNPARDANGKPVAVWTTVEVTFRFL